jgi:hypothetical protein
LKQSFNKNLELGALCSVDFCPCFPTSKWVGILTFSIFLWLVERIGTTQRHEACQNPVVCGMFVRHCAGGLRLTEMSGGTAVVQGEVLEMSQDQDCSSFCI